MDYQSSPESDSEDITTEGSIAASMEMILNTALPYIALLDPPIEMQQLIAKQIHAVVVLYNYYQRKRHPELDFLEFEPFCKLAATLQPELVPYMKSMHQSDYKSSDVPEDQLSLTEKAIMDACKICLALKDVPEDMPIKEKWPISKIVVMLVDPSKENCLYILGSVTRGVWSFLEQSIDNCKISSEGTVARKKRGRNNKKDSGEEQYTEAGYEQLAVSAIKNYTGLKKTDLMFLESHVVYSVSKEKTAARFYIVKCSVKFPEKLNVTYWVPMKEVVESLQGPLANWLMRSWTPTSVTKSYHLLPYTEILSNYFSRLKHSSHEGEHRRTIGEKSQSSQEVRPDTENEVSSGCLNDLEVMVSTSNSNTNTNEASDATIISPSKEDNNGTNMADKLDTVKNTVPKFKVADLGTLNKSCNNISVKQVKMSVGDGVEIPFQMNTNSPETVQPTFSAKEKELSVADKEEELSLAAFRVLLSKRERLTHQVRNLGDEIAICDKNIQTISDSVEREAVQDGTCQHAKDQVRSQQMKGKSIIEAKIPDQIFCQVLDRICHDNKWTSPTYSVSACDGGYIASVTVKGEDFECSVNVSDSVHSSPDAAKDSAAVQMIEKLRSFACQNK